MSVCSKGLCQLRWILMRCSRTQPIVSIQQSQIIDNALSSNTPSSLTTSVCIQQLRFMPKNEKIRPMKVPARHNRLINESEASKVVDIVEMKDNMRKQIRVLKRQFFEICNLKFDKETGVLQREIIEKLAISTPRGRFYLDELSLITAKSPRLLVVDMSRFPQYIKLVKMNLRRSPYSLGIEIKENQIFITLPLESQELKAKMVESILYKHFQTAKKIRQIEHRNIRRSSDSKRINPPSVILHVNELVESISVGFILQAEELKNSKLKELLNETDEGLDPDKLRRIIRKHDLGPVSEEEMRQLVKGPDRIVKL